MRFGFAWVVWAKLGTLGVLGIVERKHVVRELPNSGALRRPSRTCCTDPGPWRRLARAAEWLLGPDPCRILQSRNEGTGTPGPPEREPCRQAPWHALLDWPVASDAEDSPLQLRPVLDPICEDGPPLTAHCLLGDRRRKQR
jgi:hypothetical protein